MKLTSKLLTFGFTAIGAAMFFSGKASAATITVNAFTDDITVNGNCTLREAIQAANTNTAVDACIAGEASSDTIALGAGTYTMSIAGSLEDANATGDFDINSGILTIDGAGMNSTIIQGDGTNRIFDISGTATVTISDLGITNGGAVGVESGSAIGVFGTSPVNLNRVNIYGNTAGATNHIITQTIGSNLSISNSIIRNNSSQGEILVASSATTTINSTYIGENTSQFYQVYIQGPIGFSMENSTIFSSNRIALYLNGAITGSISSSTIKTASNTYYAFGIDDSSTGQITVDNTILDSESAYACYSLDPAKIVSANNNMASGSCPSLNGTNDLVNVDLQISDTPTLIGGTYVFPPLSAASIVVDGGSNPATLSVDQTGASRPQDGNGDGDNFMDVGAYELPRELIAPVITEVTPVPSPSTDTTPTYTFNASEAGYILLSGPCSLISGDVSAGNNSVTFNAFIPGTYTCGVQMRDYANNLSNVLSFTFTITAAPTATEAPTSTPTVATNTATATMTPTGTTLPDTGNSSVLGVIAGTFVVISATTVLVIYKRRLVK